jgi:hypothetical protein
MTESIPRGVSASILNYRHAQCGGIDLVSRLPGGFCIPVSPRTAPFRGGGFEEERTGCRLRGGGYRQAYDGNLQELSLGGLKMRDRDRGGGDPLPAGGTTPVPQAWAGHGDAPTWPVRTGRKTDRESLPVSILVIGNRCTRTRSCMRCGSQTPRYPRRRP